MLKKNFPENEVIFSVGSDEFISSKNILKLRQMSLKIVRYYISLVGDQHLLVNLYTFY